DKAMRTLALAYKQLDSDVVESIKDNSLSAELLQDLCLQAVFAISDPIRDDVPNAVSECQRAGINVKMVTGDTSATAIEIAKQIGIWNEEGVSESEKERWHITGTQFADLDDNEAYERVASLKVMSRARPTDKQRLVELLQARNEVVAVTGDGTNDAPALNHAHVGLSLGSGTSVAKEASAMTLLDDSFSSITLAVMWGRSLYRNIQRFLYFQLIVNLTALLLVVGGAFIGTYMPLTVTQILWVNLIMDTFAAMALASLPPSKDVLNEMPRKQSDFIISKSMFRGILAHGIFFFIVLFSMLYYYGNEVSNGITTHHLTIFFTTFVMIQLWNLFNAKTFGCKDSAFSHLKQSKGLLFVFLIVLIGQWLIVSFGGKMFRTEPLSLTEWGVIIALTSLVLWVEELKRLWTRRTK
ncbi:MAG: cation-translocating P-type ATPase, partial [Prevotella nanceiensis]|nr:cation-translocating P-type ATPase [Hoylesella nanceiensis]